VVGVMVGCILFVFVRGRLIDPCLIPQRLRGYLFFLSFFLGSFSAEHLVQSSFVLGGSLIGGVRRLRRARSKAPFRSEHDISSLTVFPFTRESINRADPKESKKYLTRGER
jgi:hypothetical protein